MFDPEKFGEAMGEAIRAAVEPLQKRIGELESSLSKMHQRSEPAIPLDGKDGRDGKDWEPEVVKAWLADAVKAIPVPQNGRDGSSITAEDVAPLIRAEVDRIAKEIPVPKDGLGMAGAMIDRDGALQITFTNGEVKNLGRVEGKDGRDGKNGQDGVSFESFDIEYLPETHEVCVKAGAAGRVKEVRYPAGGIRPAGYWREGTKAVAGEAWVHDGSLWIAVKSTPAKPTTGDDWIIAARKGRDGERGAKGLDGTPVQPIKLKAE